MPVMFLKPQAAGPIRNLHFADAHTDANNRGRLDPSSGLPVRVMDCLRSLDTIVDTAIAWPADLVTFGGDGFRGRNRTTTIQREFDRRMQRVSDAGIPIVLVVGNHDGGPAHGRAHVFTHYQTLQVPNVHVADRITLFSSQDLGCPVQVIAVPWSYGLEEIDVETSIDCLLEQVDPELPTILVAHAMVTGARYGSGQPVSLGEEMLLSKSTVARPGIDFVALGHIHGHQSLNDDGHPPIVYPGSIERVNFGEANETKGFIKAKVAKGHTGWEFVPLETRRFVDMCVEPNLPDYPDYIVDELSEVDIVDAVVRLTITYPAEHESLIDDAAIQRALESALEARVIKCPQRESRVRISDDVRVETMTPEELLGLYWDNMSFDGLDRHGIKTMGVEIIESVDRRDTDGE